MTDDQTRSYETPKPSEPGTEPAPAADAAAGAGAPAPSTPAGDPLASPAPAAAASAGAGSAAASADVAPAAAPGAPVRSGNGLRWALGLGVATLVLVITAGAIFLLGAPSSPEALRYVPADSAAVIEARFDLPGDQLQKLGNMLAHFPGFADQSTLPAKIDEAFSRLVTEASGGNANYMTEIKPWLNGPVFIAGDAAAFAAAQGDAAGERFLLSATTNSAVACPTTFDNQPVAHETYRGLDLVTVQGGGFACVVDGRIGLLGDAASVREALDTKADGKGMDKSGGYSAARKQLTGDQLATIYIAGDVLRAAVPSADPGVAIPGMESFAARIPDWIMLGVRAEDDALLFDGVVAPIAAPSGGPSLLPVPAGHASVIAPQVPAGTLVYFEDQGTGISLQNLFAQLRSIPDLEAPLQMLDGVGGPAGLVGWIDDAAIAISAVNPTLEDPGIKASVYLVAKDDATANEKLATVKAAVGLAGLSGEGITVATEAIAGVEVTTVTVTDLGSLVPPGSVPGVDAGTLDTPVSFSLAARGRIIYLTIGDGAMAEVLGIQAGASLADDAAFKLAAQRGLANSKTTFYMAAGATVDLVEGLVPQEMAGQWAEIAPYVDPLEALGFSVSSDASATRSRLVLTVTQPQP